MNGLLFITTNFTNYTNWPLPAKDHESRIWEFENFLSKHLNTRKTLMGLCQQRGMNQEFENFLSILQITRKTLIGLCQQRIMNQELENLRISSLYYKLQELHEFGWTFDKKRIKNLRFGELYKVRRVRSVRCWRIITASTRGSSTSLVFEINSP